MPRTWFAGASISPSAALIVVVAGALHLGRQRATEAALEAESSLGHVGALQELSADLAAPRPRPRSRTRSRERAASLFGAQGAALGLLESDDVLVVEPIGIAAQPPRPGPPASRSTQATLLSAAIREDTLVRANDRATLERDFPDSAAILPSLVGSAVAMPLRVGGKPVGVVEFLFDRENALDDELAAVAVDRRGACGAGARARPSLRSRAGDRTGRSTASCRSRRASTPTPPTR